MSKVQEILQSIKPEVDFGQSTDFVEDGLLDSLELISLIEELETTFDVEIDPMDILPENFSSIQRIEEMLAKCGGTLL